MCPLSQMSNIKSRLKKGESVLGTFVNIYSLEIIRILKVAGFDYFVIDNEHSYIDYEHAANMLNIARALKIAGIVRIPELNREVVLKYMEMGADGILMPNCETAEQCKKLIEYAKYKPVGNRGVSLFRPHSGYRPILSGKEYMEATNQDSLMIVQIESKKGVENIDAILSVDGIDAVFIGPSDLSQAYNLFGQLDNSILMGVINKVIEAAKVHNKFSGIFSGGKAEDMNKWIDRGMTLNLWSNDVGILMDNAKKGVSIIKSNK